MDLDSKAVLFAFLLTLIAGLSTGIGGLVAWSTKHTHRRLLSVALGFSAGVMVYVSLVEMFQQSRVSLAEAYGEKAGAWLSFSAFFCGIFIAAIIDKLVPSAENPHEVHTIEEKNRIKDKRLMRTGVLVAIALAIHNFPEGLVTFVAGLSDGKIGLSVAFAVALHNIPEGISVSVPIYHATRSRNKALFYSSLSGLAEPLGALIGFLLFRQYLGSGLLGVLLAAVAGIMIFISMDELLPAAREYGEHHLSIYGFIAGMAIMGASLNMFV